MKTMPFLPAILMICFFAGCATRPPLATVQQVDLKRYSGKWHEIARYPNWFQKDCTGTVTADYTPLPGGAIRVVNTCQTSSGSTKSITGRATVVPGTGKAHLKVSFFGPFAGDYWIIGLDEKNYSWALVGHPSRKYLWILSRQPKMPDSLYQKIVALAVKNGYSAERIVRDN
jgi:apolipoprotein D and lipocalin family protein